MKQIIVLAITFLSIVACKQNEPEVKIVEVASEELVEIATKETNKDLYKDYAKVEFGIKGMTCAMGCAKAIEKKIAKLEGVHFVNVDFDKELAMVEFDDKKLTNEDFLKAVNKVSDTYKVGEISKVEVFAKDKCKADCKKACCVAKKMETKTACAKDCKKACCVNKDEAKMACTKDCKKACCNKTV